LAVVNPVKWKSIMFMCSDPVTGVKFRTYHVGFRPQPPTSHLDCQSKLFVCLFVCLYKTRKSILRSLCLEGSNNPWEWLHTESDTDHVRDTGDSGTNHVLVNQWLTLYKLTGWFASLDLRKPYTDASSTTEITTPYALTFCCRGKNLKEP